MKTSVNIPLYFSALLLLNLMVACKENPRQVAFDQLIAEGILLSINDTVQAKVGDKLLYAYGFSSGVENIHYLLTYHCEDSLLSHEGYKEFFLADEEVAGGHSEGVHIFTAKQQGLAKVVFYNPHYNAEFYYKEAHEEMIGKEDIVKDFCDAYQIPKVDTTWSEEQIEEANTAWLEKFGETLDARADSIMAIHAKKYTLRQETQEVLDSLYSIVLIDKVREWYHAQQVFISTLPLHPKTQLKTCYVQIK